MQYFWIARYIGNVLSSAFDEMVVGQSDNGNSSGFTKCIKLRRKKISKISNRVNRPDPDNFCYTTNLNEFW